MDHIHTKYEVIWSALNSLPIKKIWKFKKKMQNYIGKVFTILTTPTIKDAHLLTLAGYFAIPGYPKAVTRAFIYLGSCLLHHFGRFDWQTMVSFALSHRKGGLL